MQKSTVDDFRYTAATDTWDEGLSQIGEVIDFDDATLVVNNRREARGRASGANVEFSYWIVATFRSGRAFRLEWFADRSEAIEAAGVSK